MFYWIPLWGLYIGTVVLILLSLELGYRSTRIRLKSSGDLKPSNLGSMVGATLGLLAFILAITFGAGIQRFEARKVAMVNEVNAVGTTWLRAGMLTPDSERKVKELLHEYMDFRADTTLGKNPQRLRNRLIRSEEIHHELWDIAMRETQDTIAPPYVASFISSLNETIDLHLLRVTAGLRSAIPSVIWIVLYAIMVLCMLTIGYEAGIGGAYKSLIVVAIAFVFASVVYLIADLERPTQGLVRLDTTPLYEQAEAFREELDK